MADSLRDWLLKARPDFCVFPLKGNPFYLEATVATGTSAAEEAGAARTAAVRDAVNQIKTKNFFLWVRQGVDVKFGFVAKHRGIWPIVFAWGSRATCRGPHGTAP